MERKLFCDSRIQFGCKLHVAHCRVPCQASLPTQPSTLGTNVQQICADLCRSVPGLSGPITSSSPGKQKMAIPAQQDQSNTMRGADLLLRGLWLSSFCFLEMIWKHKERRSCSELWLSKISMGDTISLISPRKAPFAPTPELISYLKAPQTTDTLR